MNLMNKVLGFHFVTWIHIDTAKAGSISVEIVFFCSILQLDILAQIYFCRATLLNTIVPHVCVCQRPLKPLPLHFDMVMK